jgi:CHAT domain-containing protein/tetratricopeptide (TPR) repeat protein
LRIERGEFTTALELSQRALANRTAGLPPDAPAIADSLDRTGDALIFLERFDQARPVLTRALAIREPRAAAQALPLARTLERLAWLERFAGDYRGARTWLQRAEPIRGAQAPHPDAAMVAVLAGDLLWFEGEVAKAAETWTRGVARVEEMLGPDHPWIVSLSRRLLAAHDALGDRDRAQRLLDAILPLVGRVVAPCSPDALGVRGYVPSRLAYEGDYTRARSELRTVQAMFETCLGPRSSRAATIVYNRALLAVRMGDYAEAERLHRQTIARWSKALLETHPFVSRGWEGLGDVAYAQGRYERARQLYLRALAARRGAATPNQAQIAWTLANVARTLMALGRLSEAERYAAEALDTRRGSTRTDEPDHLGRLLALKGEIETRRGRHHDAEASFTAAVEERTRVFGASHPLTSQSRADLAATALRLRSYPAALDGALAAEDAGRDHLRFTIRYLPERQAMNYAASRPRGLDLALSVAIAAAPTASGTPATASPAPRLLDAVIQSRGVILDELAARARVSDTPDPAAASLVAAAITARQRFANLVVRSLQEAVPRALLDEARSEKEAAEEALAARSADARSEQARVRIGLAPVRAVVTADAALVSFVRFDRTQAAGEGVRANWRPPVASYAAFVVRGEGADPILVPLGTAAAIDALVTSWRNEASGRTLAAGTPLAEAERTYRLAGQRLRRAIWDPLAPHLTGATRLFVVPDGQLNIVNLSALPGRPGRYLADDPVTIHYLSTERDLVMSPESSPRGSLLAVGGATFDGESTPPPTSTAQRSACEAFSQMRFPALPGSRREVSDIRRAWPDADASAVTVLSGAAATETAVKRAVSGRRVVHLATHGFFLGGECVPGLANTRGVGGLVRRASASSTADNPLLLSGLALAWANRRDKARTSQDDGILTAEEIAGLNLQGTEWAVLSACDTGLGEIKAGEGVFGLRRAFQIAGARTVIMSLWSVEDGAARLWMRALYDGRFQKTLSTSDAVRHASRTVLADRRAKGQSTHPFYWGGFVAAGDWR